MPETTRRRFTNPADALAHRTERAGDCLVFTGALNKDGYGTMRYKGKTALAHRVAWELANGPVPDGKRLDHRCHNTACCNVGHLRPVTQKQNMEHQTRAHRGSTSGVRGVYWMKAKSRWAVQIRHHGKAHYFGLYDDLAEAEAVAKAKRIELFTHNDADRKAP